MWTKGELPLPPTIVFLAYDDTYTGHPATSNMSLMNQIEQLFMLNLKRNQQVVD